MTDNEIIKALECCNRLANQTSCDDCPYQFSDEKCSSKLIDDALDLISRQKAEISVKTKLLNKAVDEIEKLQPYKLHYGNMKAEIVKEFKDRLIDCYTDEAITDDMTCSIGVIKANIHDIAREMENEQ